MFSVCGLSAQACKNLGNAGDHSKMVEELERLHTKRNGLRTKQVRAPQRMCIWKSC